MKPNPFVLKRYLLACFGLSLALSDGFVLLGGDIQPTSLSRLAMMMIFMFTPLMATLIARKSWRGLKADYDLHWPWQRWNRWWLVAWLSPLALVALTFGISLLLPGVHYSPGMEGMFARFEGVLPPEQLQALRDTPPPLHPALLALIQGLIAGLSINALAAFGEELGWRGLMSKALLPLGFWRNSLITGTVWGLWHAPIILMGHNYPEHPVLGVLMMTLFCLLFAPWFTLVRHRSGSTLAAAVMHGSFNALAGLAVMFVSGGNDLLIGSTGLAGLLALALLNLLIWLGWPETRQVPGKQYV
ncbi:MAG: CPBP family intramembrane metalloprotease [Candidatus Sericytochromatia bacterium]|nr:CPBP family intramembrane metalloprotease [Candidatus Sericytochromatia bacterium]